MATSPLPALWLVPVPRVEALQPVARPLVEEDMPLTSLDSVLLLTEPKIYLTLIDSPLAHLELTVRKEPQALFTNITVKKPHLSLLGLLYLFFPD